MEPIPRAFAGHALPVVAGAAAVVAVAGAGAGLAPPPGGAGWGPAGLVGAGELLPIHVPRRAGNDWLTVSSAFGLAVLLAYGLWPAVAVYAAASALGDAVYRTRAPLAVFNAAQYVLSLAAAAGILALLGDPTGPAVLAGAAAFFVVNELLAGPAGARPAGEPAGPSLRRDVGFQLWTGGFQLALAPLLVAAAQADAWLLPLAFCPLVAVWVGGRQAALNAYRAVHDPRTELPNRAALRDRVAGADGPTLVLAVELGELEAVRGTLGRDVADRLVAAAATRLRMALPAADAVGHLEGDHLGVVRVDGDPAAASAMVLRVLDEPLEVDGLALLAHPVVGADTGAPERADVVLNRA